MENFDTHLASLTYLTNPLYQQILTQQKLKKVSNKSDIKFYRKRILALTKDMLKGEIPDNEYIKQIYNAYVNGLIKYFKMLDTTDIIQKQYVNGILSNDSCINNEYINNEYINNECINNEYINNDDLACIKEVKLDNADDLLMRKYPSIATLDNFIIKSQNAPSDTRIIPVIIDVDLKEPSLKKKGIKHKPVKNKPSESIVTDLDKIIL